MRLVLPDGVASSLNNFQRFGCRCSPAASETAGKNQQQSVNLCWTPYIIAGEN